MEMVIRRQIGRLSCAVLLGLAGAAAPALADDCPDPIPPTIDDLPDPPELRSEDGVLRGTLTVAPAEVTVRGCMIVSNVINGDYMAPTLRVRRGDTIEVKAVNRIGAADVNIDGPEPTNIHYHGMDVAPSLEPPGDNVFIRIEPDRRLRYDVFVPEDHPQGLHWYHAHVHHFVDDQIGSGVSGMLIVEGFIEKQYPELAGLRQRVMVFKDFTFPGFEDGDARAKSLNGFADPPIRARPGEYQIWTSRSQRRANPVSPS
jgi:suppressor of ftsI